MGSSPNMNVLSDGIPSREVAVGQTLAHDGCLRRGCAVAVEGAAGKNRKMHQLEVIGADIGDLSFKKLARALWAVLDLQFVAAHASIWNAVRYGRRANTRSGFQYWQQPVVERSDLLLRFVTRLRKNHSHR